MYVYKYGFTNLSVCREVFPVMELIFVTNLLLTFILLGVTVGDAFLDHPVFARCFEDVSSFLDASAWQIIFSHFCN